MASGAHGNQLPGQQLSVTQMDTGSDTAAATTHAQPMVGMPVQEVVPFLLIAQNVLVVIGIIVNKDVTNETLRRSTSVAVTTAINCLQTREHVNVSIIRSF